MSRTDAEKSLAGKIAAHRKWATCEDRSAATAPAREAMMRRFEDEVDPDRVLSPAERAKRAENARSAYYSKLALESAKKRRLKREGQA